MGMDPDPREAGRIQTPVNLVVEEVGDRIVTETDRHRGAGLLDEDNVFHQQRIIGRRQAEAADFGLTQITQVQEFRPGIRGEQQGRQ